MTELRVLGAMLRLLPQELKLQPPAELARDTSLVTLISLQMDAVWLMGVDKPASLA